MWGTFIQDEVIGTRGGVTACAKLLSVEQELGLESVQQPGACGVWRVHRDRWWLSMLFCRSRGREHLRLGGLGSPCLCLVVAVLAASAPTKTPSHPALYVRTFKPREGGGQISAAPGTQHTVLIPESQFLI